MSRWGMDRAVLSLCAARICRLVLADVVRDEVEENLLIHVAGLLEEDAQELRDDYSKLIKLADPATIPYPSKDDVLASRHLIRHQPDVPVLLSAMKAQPDWLLTHNRRHFTPGVAKRTKLQIGSPADFFRRLAEGFS